MLAVVRSGLVEARHEVVAVAVDDTGTVVASLGDYLDRRFFYRSAIKPLQALVSQANGADLGPEETAVAASSHGGHPVHLAYVRSMLAGMGLGVDHLLCPADRPLSPVADRRAAVGGSLEAARIFHNCSGKHAAMLRACVAKGWSTDYLPAEHPLQQQVVAVVSDAAGEGPWATGVDGCGVPTVAGTVGGLARAFARLAADPTMVGVRDAMCRFSALTSDGASGEAVLSRWVPAAVKRGAQGCVGLALPAYGVGMAAKCWTGFSGPALAAVVTLLERIGIVGPYPRSRLAEVARPEVLGGGVTVGALVGDGPA